VGDWTLSIVDGCRGCAAPILFAIYGPPGLDWTSRGLSADSMRPSARGRMTGAVASHQECAGCTGRRKGAARPFGVGLRPTLPPTGAAGRKPVVGSGQTRRRALLSRMGPPRRRSGRLSPAGQGATWLRCRSAPRTRAGAGAAGSGRSRSPACVHAIRRDVAPLGVRQWRVRHQHKLVDPEGLPRVLDLLPCRVAPLETVEHVTGRDKNAAPRVRVAWLVSRKAARWLSAKVRSRPSAVTCRPGQAGERLGGQPANVGLGGQVGDEHVHGSAADGRGSRGRRPRPARRRGR
jgi:hypothetical protein